jgi:hypothetical protein
VKYHMIRVPEISTQRIGRTPEKMGPFLPAAIADFPGPGAYCGNISQKSDELDSLVRPKGTKKIVSL